MPAPPGTPGYNLDNHQATWDIIPRDTDGVDNGRSYDDSSWLRMDTTVPHSGRRSGRFALPAGALSKVLPAPLLRAAAALGVGGVGAVLSKRLPVLMVATLGALIAFSLSHRDDGAAA